MNNSKQNKLKVKDLFGLLPDFKKSSEDIKKELKESWKE